MRIAVLAPLVACLPLLACNDGGGGAAGDSTSGGSTSDPSTTTASTTVDPTTSTSGVDTGTTTGDPGAPPPTPNLVSPADGATEVAVETELCWELVEDPDGDPVRYRVFVDDIELTQGRLGEQPGYEGPCIGPLTLNYEQTYAWQVQAIHPDFPDTSYSDKSATWTFTTAGDGHTHTVFEDPFDDDLGWDVEGTATSGAWIRGEPVGTMRFADVAQPEMCAGGNNCYFTGQNPDAIVDQADVSGGSTTLTSPAFDLTGAESATVQLSRFFYKSGTETGTLLKVELLTPDDAEPDGYRHHTLEQLESSESIANSNTWTPIEYAACGLPMVAGSRLRVTATDLGSGITEGAIDSVAVIAHQGDNLCNGGEGSVCDPAMGAAACADDLLCCSQGAVNAGIYRCASSVAGIDFDNPPASPDDPGNGAMGCDAPDIFVDENALNPWIDEIFVNQNSCTVQEACVNGPGLRRLLRFDTRTPNIGSRDMAMGVPSNHPDLFHYSGCHSHYHFDNYAAYELDDGTGVIATGHKQAFCLIDLESWAWPQENGNFDCGNQGISRGFADIYGSYLDCQWIDITDVPAGTYTLRIRLNNPPAGTDTPIINERDYDNNVAEIQVDIPPA